MTDEPRERTTKPAVVLAMAGGMMAVIIVAMILLGFLAEFVGDRINVALERVLPKVPPLLRDVQTDLMVWFPLILVSAALVMIVILCFIWSGISRLNESIVRSHEETKRAVVELQSTKYQIIELTRIMKERSDRTT